ncbi:MAG TPA: HD domain-containing phosphohydrolase [Patescibacteria group bacterium]|nr:HD domain-containing phosphohydrolase [Patescibacteria group bacterium]
MKFLLAASANENVLDLLPCPVMKINQEFSFLYLNPAARFMIGFKPEQGDQQHCYEIMGKEVICPGCPVKRAFSSKQVEKYRQCEYTSGGKFLFQENTALPVLGTNGDVDYVISVEMDVVNYLKRKQEWDAEDTQILVDFAGIVEKRDQYHERHAERVSKLAVMIGEKVGVSNEKFAELYLAAMLHDIGKICIPESVLMKTGRLNAQDWQEIKKHPLAGFELLSQFKQMENVAQAVLYHHERMDGKGYPHRIAGKDIPLTARILHAADVFEALTAQRIYRSPLSVKVALTIMKGGQGTQFDAEVLDELMKLSLDSQLENLFEEEFISA